MDWRPAPSWGGWIGLAMLAALDGGILACIVLGWRAWPGPEAALFGLAAVILAPCGLWLGYWVWGRLSLHYDVGRDGVAIRWAAHRHVIPMASITHVLNGRPYSAPLRGFRWPGHEVGRTRLVTGDADGVAHDTLVYATVPPEGQVVIVTADLAYAISPADRAGFVDEFKARRRLGTVQTLDQHTELAGWLSLPVWQDGVALALVIVALAANVLTFAWLTWHYPVLPADVVLVHKVEATPGQPAPALAQPLATAWLLPAIAFAALAANTVTAGIVHRYARLGARLLVLGALLVQLAVTVIILKLH